MGKVLSPENKENLLKRHQDLTCLAIHLSGSAADFLHYLQCVCKFEKALEAEKDIALSQCGLFKSLVKNDQDLRQILFSKEWQKAQEYFTTSSNIETLIDICNLLELGRFECSSQNPQELRRELLHKSFIVEQGGVVKYKGVTLRFYFSQEIPRWSVKKISWDIEKNSLLGEFHISLGAPKANAEGLHRNVFAIYGDEKKTACVVALYAWQNNNEDLKYTSQKELSQMNFKWEELVEKFQHLPKNVLEKMKDLEQASVFDRELSPQGLSFLIKLLAHTEENSKEYQYLSDRFERSGLKLSPSKVTQGYEFSDKVPQGEVFVTEPALEYYWPPKNNVEVAYPGGCRLSAGVAPDFLKSITKLVEEQKIQVRQEDLQKIKEMLFYITIQTSKISKPPLLPLYNALRRLFEAISEKANRGLEQLCEEAKVFRPFVHIPCLNEKLPATEGPGHNVSYRLEEKAKVGTILSIKNSAIIVSGGNMPLCLPGNYVIARSPSTKEQLLEMLSSLLDTFDQEFHQAWKTLCNQDDVSAFLTILNQLLLSCANLDTLLWKTLCQAAKEIAPESFSLLILDRKLSLQKIKDLQENKQIKLKITHIQGWDEGVVISQDLQTTNNTVTIASGISPEILESIKNLHMSFTNETSPIQTWISQIDSFFLSKLTNKKKQLKDLIDKASNASGIAEDLALLKEWYGKNL